MSIADTVLPLLQLHPHIGEWAAKSIPLGNKRIPIGRKCTPVEAHPEVFNGYFDSKVLSRQHAEIWQENGKVYIKDTKSVNGTFVNGQRLGSPGEESPPFELKSDDILELGIDVLAEDKQTVRHHKISARVEYATQ